MAVGATNRSGNRASYSNTGTYIEIAAPGGDSRDSDASGNGFIWQSTIRPSLSDPGAVLFPRFDSYAEVGYSGTSMATPHVAGLAALLVTQGIKTPAAIEQLIKKTAKFLGTPSAADASRNDDFGFGLIQPRPALFGTGSGSRFHAPDSSICVCGGGLRAGASGDRQRRTGQSPDARSAPPRKPLSISLRAYGIFDFNNMAAKESFEAVLGTSQLKGFGGGVEVDIWKHLFVRVAGTRARETGSRVFVSGSEVFPLGIPLTVTMTPIEAGGGWRFETKSGRLTPYAGVSYLSMGYAEESDFAEAGENTSERFAGQAVFGGAEFRIWKWFIAAGEAQYRRVPERARRRRRVEGFRRERSRRIYGARFDRYPDQTLEH